MGNVTELVALRKESVDRNSCGDTLRPPALVALRKESVDRNPAVAGLLLHTPVALRKESVDRNEAIPDAMKTALASLSARRAWIEMALPLSLPPVSISRSPQGERG